MAPSRIPGGSLTLGRWIARRREDLGLAQSDLAAKLGFSVETLRKIERGKRGLRNDGEIIMLARELDVSEVRLREAAEVLTDRSPGVSASLGIDRETRDRLIQEAKRHIAALQQIIESFEDPEGTMTPEMLEDLYGERAAVDDPVPSTSPSKEEASGRRAGLEHGLEQAEALDRPRTKHGRSKRVG